MTRNTEVIIIEEDIHIFFVQANSFPDGIEAAHTKLKEVIGQSDGRVLYGISRPEEGRIVYRSGAEEQFRGEGAKYNCSSLILRKGKYAAIKIENYADDLTIIGKAFDLIIKRPDLDTQGYCVEQYLNEKEMICMVRLEI